MFEARQAAACAVSGEPQEEATAFERELERLIRKHAKRMY